MEIISLLLFMMIIGALIGTITNYIAIKMLFRPYRPLYIGNYRLPFTPGLIPKRRKELAEQTGKIVVEHLLTAEGIQKKFHDPAFQQEVLAWAKREADKLLKNEDKLLDHLTRLFGADVTDKFQAWRTGYVEKWYEKKMAQLRMKTIAEALPEQVMKAVDEKIGSMSPYIIERAVIYFESEEGIEKLKELIDTFLATRGAFGNMIQMFLGNANLVGKIQPEVIKFLKSDGMQVLVSDLILAEYNKVKLMTVEKAEERIGRQHILDMLQELVAKEVSLEKFGNKTVRELLAPFATHILDTYLPKGIDKIGKYLSSNMTELLERLSLADIVREQVESFPIERLEQVVLSISRRELKLITYLGGLLGGIIGIIQGIIVLLFGAN